MPIKNLARFATALAVCHLAACSEPKPRTETSTTTTPQASFESPEPEPSPTEAIITSRFQFQVSDGEAFSQPQNTMNIDVELKNDPPSSADNTITIREDTPYVFRVEDFIFRDPDNTELEEVKITSSVTRGKLLHDGTEVNQDDVFRAASIKSESLEFRPDSNDHSKEGQEYTHFTFKVGDGAAFSTSPNRMAINVLSENDPPTSADNTVYTDDSTVYVFSPADFPYSDVHDVDPLSAVLITNLDIDGQLLLNDQAVAPNQKIAIEDIEQGRLKFVPAQATFFSLAPDQTDPMVEVTRIVNRPGVSVTRNGEPLDVREGSRLQKGDRITTEPRTVVDLTFRQSDDTEARVRVFAETQMRISSVGLDEGEIGVDTNGAFAVKDKTVDVITAHTAFSVKRRGDDVSVVTCEGVVQVSPNVASAEWSPIQVSAGSIVTVRDGLPPETPRQATDSELARCAKLDIFFAVNKDLVREEEKDRVRETVRVIANDQSGRYSIVGYTDERGKESYNMGLGLRRAQSVQRFLEGEQIDPRRLFPIASEGETLATKGCKDESCWSPDRRAEVRRVGNWSVHVASFNNRSTAEQQARLLRENVTVEQVTVAEEIVVEDRIWHRVSFIGFESEVQAREFVRFFESKTGMRGAWVERAI